MSRRQVLQGSAMTLLAAPLPALLTHCTSSDDAVDTFRNVYTLNYETIANAPQIEPSLSQWAPSTPGM
jgi:hypothetical protein